MFVLSNDTKDVSELGPNVVTALPHIVSVSVVWCGVVCGVVWCVVWCAKQVESCQIFYTELYIHFPSLNVTSLHFLPLNLLTT